MKQVICRILARIVVGISLPVMGQAMAQAAPVGENSVATSEQPNIGGGHVKDIGNNTFRGVRYFGNGENFAYFEFTDFKSDWAFENPNVFELYDLKNDPNQTHNIVSSADPGTLQMLQKLTHTYWSCSGELCP